LPVRAYAVTLQAGMCIDVNLQTSAAGEELNNPTTAPFRVILAGIPSKKHLGCSTNIHDRFIDGQHVLSVLRDTHLASEAMLQTLRAIFRHQSDEVELTFDTSEAVDALVVFAVDATRRLPALQVTPCVRYLER
jgi:hypothetical protein